MGSAVTELPKEFTDKMEKLLGDEFGEFRKSYEEERAQGLRINCLKADPVRVRQAAPFALTPVPWLDEGCYYGGPDRPGRHPWHEAGVYYIQEPSAMAAVAALDPKPGERILDLCAAPGGKSTHIASRMMGRGFLLSNEIHPSRARILSQNIERMGIGNCVVSNMDSGSLSVRFPFFFDRILVDAPCSGEGMFRKNEEARGEWSPEHVRACAARQLDILRNAAGMLRPGGRLVYSTCTFSPEENEGTAQAFLELHKDFAVEGVLPPEGWSGGRPDWVDHGNPDLKKTWRLWPHRCSGEGHYIAAFRKREGEGAGGKGGPLPAYVKDSAALELFGRFCSETLLAGSGWAGLRNLVLFGDQLYRIPPEMPDYKGMRILRPGLHLGTLKKNRFEPSHALALHLSKDQALRWADLPGGGQRVLEYLRGESLRLEELEKSQCHSDGKGWLLVLTDGYSLGWGKLSAGVVKNHYPKGLRGEL